jgi:3-methylcrotonyl-CoA carboxylase alpha subunit
MAEIVVTPGSTPGELIIRDGDRIERLFGTVSGGTTWIFHQGVVYEIAAETGRRRTTHAHGAVTAPMPATVIAVNAAPGDSVKHGDVLIVLEAMKMELPVRAPGDGKVAAVHCRPGDLVQPDVSLIDFE